MMDVRTLKLTAARIVCLSALLVPALLFTVSAQAQQDRNMEVRGFRVPEYDSQGNMTSQLFGDRAEMLGGGDVKITGLKIEFYREGETVMTVKSPYCFFNQHSRNAHSDAPVEADMERVQIRGRGFELDAAENKVRVLNDSHVTILNADRMTGKEKTPEEGIAGVTVITSEQLMLDYKNRTARFEKNVHVTDPRMEMFCEELEMQFDEDNEVSWIGAFTGVRILSEGREAQAGRASYDIRNDEILLEDQPRLFDGRNMLAGEQIRFWRAEGRMVCEPSARMIVYSSGLTGADFFGN